MSSMYNACYTHKCESTLKYILLNYKKSRAKNDFFFKSRANNDALRQRDSLVIEMRGHSK